MSAEVTTLNYKQISVCMATYNGERFIQPQIESILAQLGPDDELIISDDASCDSTRNIVETFCDSRIILLHNPKPGSLVRNFEYALLHAKGDYIFLADQDDVWELNKVAIQTNFLKDYDLVVSDCYLIDSKGLLISDSFFNQRRSGPGFIKNLHRNSFLGCCMAFRKSVLNKALPFPSSIAMHDIWIGLIAECYGKTFFCKDRLVRYRRHGANASRTGGESILTFKAQVSYRIYFLFALFLRVVFHR